MLPPRAGRRQQAASPTRRPATWQVRQAIAQDGTRASYPIASSFCGQLSAVRRSAGGASTAFRWAHASRDNAGCDISGGDQAERRGGAWRCAVGTRGLSGDRSLLESHAAPVPRRPCLSLSQGMTLFPAARQDGRADRMGSRCHACVSDSSAAL